MWKPHPSGFLAIEVYDRTKSDFKYAEACYIFHRLERELNGYDILIFIISGKVQIINLFISLFLTSVLTLIFIVGSKNLNLPLYHLFYLLLIASKIIVEINSLALEIYQA